MIVTLGDDLNPSVPIHICAPETWIRGRVVEEQNCSLANVQTASLKSSSGSAVSAQNGSFAFLLKFPQEEKVGLRAERRGWAPETAYCFAGREGCEIVLSRQ